ncbi:MAG: response regulator [Proteobacteria bacterium]|nr:response regulator [Pseudomonadota bacterium]
MNPSDTSHPAPAPRSADAGYDDGPIDILIVDDEPGNLAVLETLLDDPGYRLVRATSADEALLALVREEFALLILDIHLPDMSGFELAHLIKERRRTASVPIIFLTAYYDQDQHVLEGYGSGAVDFLHKPVVPTALRSKVAVFADLYRKSRALLSANRALLAEVAERRRAEHDLRDLNATLEHRVVERTDALRAADLRLREMMGSITDGLMTLDLDGGLTFVNDQAARLMGRTAAELLGRSIREVYPEALRGAAQSHYSAALASRRTLSFEEFHPAPVNRWFQCHCYPSDAGVSVYFLDITDKRELDHRREELLAAERAARAEGERIARAKDDFLALLSHELRTPLAAILGWTAMLRRPDADPDNVRRGIEVIERNARAQAQLIADLLDVGRIVSGKLRMNVARVDLAAVAEAAIDAMRPAADAKGVRIVARLERAAPLDVQGDPERLHQIVSNLLTNALKFTPADGTIALAVKRSGEHVELEVADSGVGISAEFLPHVFEPFSQADGSAARAHGGLGLGLSIVKSLVVEQGGSVTAHSGGAGSGSTFRVRLPSADAAGSPVAPSDASPHAVDAVRAPAAVEVDLSGIAVLLVDDHEDVAEVGRRLLEERGARVATVHSGAAAVEHLRSGRCDVLLSDLGMPEMDGYTLIRRVRDELGLDTARLPAAAITAFVRPEDLARARAEGFQAVVQKPISPYELCRTVQDLVRPSRAPDRGGASPASGALRLLFVEDDSDLLEAVEALLAEEDVELVACSSGEEALARFEDGRYDLVITDVGLPGMTGIELAGRLLAREPALWLAFSTGHALERQVTEIGPNVRMLLKPYDWAVVQALLEEIRAHATRVS